MQCVWNIYVCSNWEIPWMRFESGIGIASIIEHERARTREEDIIIKYGFVWFLYGATANKSVISVFYWVCAQLRKLCLFINLVVSVVVVVFISCFGVFAIWSLSYISGMWLRILFNRQIDTKRKMKKTTTWLASTEQKWIKCAQFSLDK